MQISRVSDEKSIPRWASAKSIEESAPVLDNVLTEQQVQRIVSMHVDMNEESVVEEKDYIEACSSTDLVYHYNGSWDKSLVSELKEYAMACGMNMKKFQSIDPEEVRQIKVATETPANGIVRVASSESDESSTPQLVLDDPFHLDDLGDMSHMEETDWQTPKKASKLQDTPTFNNGFHPVRGGDDYFENAPTQTARGRNSLDNPDAIEEYAKSESEDNGSRLAREAQEREDAKVQAHETWEQDKIASMEGKDIVPQGKVFPTESMTAQTGIRSDRNGVYSDYDAKDMPEKTAGEQLAEKSEAARKSIQREAKEDEWQQMSKQKSRSISDEFGAELEKALKKED